MDEIEEKRGPGRPQKPKTLPVVLLRNYWPVGGGKKLLKGAEVDLPADEARAAVSAGVAVRNDEF